MFSQVTLFSFSTSCHFRFISQVYLGEMAMRQTPLTCSGHTRPVVDLAFSGITPYGYFLISACKGESELYCFLLNYYYSCQSITSWSHQGKHPTRRKALRRTLESLESLFWLSHDYDAHLKPAIWHDIDNGRTHSWTENVPDASQVQDDDVSTPESSHRREDLIEIENFKAQS